MHVTERKCSYTGKEAACTLTATECVVDICAGRLHMCFAAMAGERMLAIYNDVCSHM